MINLDILGSVASQLHREFRNIFYLLLPAFFCLALILAWVRSQGGGPDFVDALKRVVIASLLLAGFQEITDAILAITTGVTQKISNMDDLEAYMRMVSEKAATIHLSPMGAILAVDDFIMAVLSYLSYFVVYLVRFLMMSVYHFTWIFLIILSPLLLLFHVFTSKVTLNLFRSLIEVACWPIVWAVLSVMLKSLPYGNFAAADSSYLTLIILNFVIAIALVMTPFLVKGLVSGTFTAVAGSLGPITAAAISKTPAKAISLAHYVATGQSMASKAAAASKSGAAMKSMSSQAPRHLKKAADIPASSSLIMAPPPPNRPPIKYGKIAKEGNNDD